MIRCPFCGFQGNFKVLKTWRFLFYSVNRLECPSYGGIFNHYHGTSRALTRKRARRRKDAL
jgi:hypothetical protein